MKAQNIQHMRLLRCDLFLQSVVMLLLTLAGRYYFIRNVII